jgi:DNA-binding response OmpR family regulator
MRSAVILHERLGKWSRQLRPRLSELSVRWLESRSPADLEGILEGLAVPVVLIDLGGQPMHGLEALDLVRTRTPGARTLVLDPEAKADRRILARELGATHVCSGFAPPPFVAGLIDRWITIARRATESAGWSRTTFPETATDPWGWLNDYLDERARSTEAPTASRGWPRSILEG